MDQFGNHNEILTVSQQYWFKVALYHTSHLYESLRARTLLLEMGVLYSNKVLGTSIHASRVKRNQFYLLERVDSSKLHYSLYDVMAPL